MVEAETILLWSWYDIGLLAWFVGRKARKGHVCYGRQRSRLVQWQCRIGRHDLQLLPHDASVQRRQWHHHAHGAWRETLPQQRTNWGGRGRPRGWMPIMLLVLISISIVPMWARIFILRLRHSSFIDIWVTFWDFQYDMLPPIQWKHQNEIPLEVELVLYDHLQHCTIHFHIIFSYQYNHCEATAPQVILISDLFIENFNIMCLLLPINA